MTYRRAQAPHQPSFFDAVPAEPIPLTDFGQQVRTVLAETLASARDQRGLDRHAVAAEMNRLGGDGLDGREVTKRMLDNWCAPSAADARMPLEALPLLHHATGDGRLLTLLNTACGQKALPAEAAALGELMVIAMQKRELAERERELARRLPQGAREWAARELRRGGR